MLSIVSKRCDEPSVRTQRDEALLQLEPVFPSVLRRNTLDARQGVRVKQRSDEEAGWSRGRCVQARWRDQRRDEKESCNQHDVEDRLRSLTLHTPPDGQPVPLTLHSRGEYLQFMYPGQMMEMGE